jgi:hypothetical protein
MDNRTDMNAIFRQTRGMVRFEGEILDNGVRYRESGVLRSSEFKVAFEQIDDEITRVFHVSRLYLAICTFFGFMLAFRLYGFVTSDETSLKQLIVAVFWFVIPVFGTWMHSPRLVGYRSSVCGLFFIEKRGKADPVPFLDSIHQAKLAYLRERYATEPADVSATSKVPSPPDPGNTDAN